MAPQQRPLPGRLAIASACDQTAQRAGGAPAACSARRERRREPCTLVAACACVGTQAWLALARPVLKAVARREAILAEKAEFERTSSDPSRLLGTY
jgi:hypothetical protein